MTKITATVPVFINASIWSTDDLRAIVDRGNLKGAVSRLILHDMTGCDGYVQVGAAEVTVTLMSPSETAAAEVAALNAQLDAARAEFHAKQAEILERISKLQALEHSA